MSKIVDEILRKKRGKQKPGRYQRIYPNLWSFFDGAFQANSGGRAREENFEEFTIGQLMRAENELKEVIAIYSISLCTLGAMADAGYTLFGQTMQEDADKPDDKQHKLLAFTLLDTLY